MRRQYFAGAANIGAESIEKTFLFFFFLNIGIGVVHKKYSLS